MGRIHTFWIRVVLEYLIKTTAYEQQADTNLTFRCIRTMQTYCTKRLIIMDILSNKNTYGQFLNLNQEAISYLSYVSSMPSLYGGVWPNLHLLQA